MTALILAGATQPASTVTSSQAFDSLTGVKQSLPHCHFPMQSGGKDNPFPIALADSFWNKGQLYLHTWGTWDLTTRIAWTAADVTAGKYDAYLHAQAAALKKWAHPVFIRLDHEMQGSWAPWYAPGPDFVAIWQHIVDLFRQDGATNVTWAWCPNQIDPGSPDIAAWYPGDDYVDWTGFDTYNGAAARGNAWQTWAQVAGLSYQTIAALAPSKPMLIGEFACHDAGGSKAAWITDALKVVIPRDMPLIRAISWFSKVDRGANWPLSATDGSAAAYGAAVKSGPYAVPSMYPMPPDLQPIKPLQSAQWGDSYSDLAKQLAADLKLANDGLASAQRFIDDQSAQLTAAAQGVVAMQNRVASAEAEVEQWRSAGGQVTVGLDLLRDMQHP